MKQPEDTTNQSRPIITTIFRLLSFLSSVFSMNNKEFGDKNWSISQQIVYIFSISAGVVFISLPLAFSAWIRAFIWSAYARTSTAVAVRSGFYDLYLKLPTDVIHKDAADRIYNAKKDKRKEYFKRKGEKRIEAEERIEAEKKRLDEDDQRQLEEERKLDEQRRWNEERRLNEQRRLNEELRLNEEWRYNEEPRPEGKVITKSGSGVISVRHGGIQGDNMVNGGLSV
ncbi:hypothetical protein F4678DRAFT_87807 [Xylaria arbuscula]|nr:hypothetical protein F4678DRAFT_87807 [Xylaria arbuscula]